ncbi:MAG: hypothetical protein K6F28_06670 [Lachnospiraceae bacterium]|nr:hypothetical protein [Lachnospiraceae bacterium]
MKPGRLFVSAKTAMYIRELYPAGEADRRIRQLGRKKAAAFALVISLTLTAFIPVFIYNRGKLAEPVTALERRGYGEGSRTVRVRVRARAGIGYEEDYRIDVHEKRYSDREIEEMSKRLDEELWTAILGKNPDPENVTCDLDLAESIKGYPFRISWKSEKPLILSSKGVIDTEKLRLEDPDDKGVEVRLCANLRYEDHSEDKYAYVIIRSRKKEPGDVLKESIDTAVKERDEETRTDDIQSLPVSAAGQKITFYDASPNKGWIILFTGIVSAFLLMAQKDRKIKEQAEYRRKQIEEDHSLILNQYMLYFMAGMNPRAIWWTICKKYEDSLNDKKADRRYAYEEMLAARNMMDEGCSELSVYDEFSDRMDNIRYRSFVSFVKQAVVKGNEGLFDLLHEEMDKAQREKNNLIKKRASEAETKLLLPMFMMLLVVLAIVMIPAFIELN